MGWQALLMHGRILHYCTASVSQYFCLKFMSLMLCGNPANSTTTKERPIHVIQVFLPASLPELLPPSSVKCHDPVESVFFPHTYNLHSLPKRQTKGCTLIWMGNTVLGLPCLSLKHISPVKCQQGLDFWSEEASVLCNVSQRFIDLLHFKNSRNYCDSSLWLPEKHRPHNNQLSLHQTQSS